MSCILGRLVVVALLILLPHQHMGFANEKVQACVCMDVGFTHCSTEFGAFPGNAPPLTCGGNCNSVPLGNSPTEVIWECSQLGQSTFTVISQLDWISDPHKKGTIVYGPGILGKWTLPYVCYVDETCFGCEYSETAQRMVCKVAPVIHSIAQAEECLDANDEEIVCDGSPG